MKSPASVIGAFRATAPRRDQCYEVQFFAEKAIDPESFEREAREAGIKLWVEDNVFVHYIEGCNDVVRYQFKFNKRITGRLIARADGPNCVANMNHSCEIIGGLLQIHQGTDVEFPSSDSALFKRVKRSKTAITDPETGLVVADEMVIAAMSQLAG